MGRENICGDGAGTGKNVWGWGGDGDDSTVTGLGQNSVQVQNSSTHMLTADPASLHESGMTAN